MNLKNHTNINKNINLITKATVVITIFIVIVFNKQLIIIVTIYFPTISVVRINDLLRLEIILISNEQAVLNYLFKVTTLNLIKVVDHMVQLIIVKLVTKLTIKLIIVRKDYFVH